MTGDVMRYRCLLLGFIAIFLCCVPAYAASGSIGASQPTTFRSDGTCSITLSWGTTGVTAAEVWVFPAAGASQKLFTGTQGTQILNWIQAIPQQYTFGLYTTVNGSRGTLLSSTTVAISSTLSLSVSPSSSQSLNYGDTLSYTITVRDPSGNPMNGASVNIIDTTYGGAGRQFTVTTDSNGRATYGYTINTLIAAGTYTLTFGPATKAGWNQSTTLTRQVTVLPPPKFLTLDVQPSSNVNARPGDSVTYTTTVTDNNNNRIANATIPVFNPLTSNTSLNTNSNGTATYSFTVPSSTQSNTYTLTFGQATASGYSASGYVQRSLTVAAQTPVLTLDVQPAATQAALPGQSVTYTLTVRDGNNNPIQGATVTITNPFTAFNTNVTTDGNGNATYVLSVPSGQGTATYTVFFLNASKSGYTNSAGTSRQLTVTQASSPTTVLSMTAQGQTAGNNGTLNLVVSSGGSVNISFNASGSSAGSGTITAYEWRSNNTVISTASSFTKNFGTPSNSITLTVTNSFGLTSTTSALINITINSSTEPTLVPASVSGPQLTSTFIVTGTGFTPNSSIQLYMTPPGGNLLVLAPATSDASGQFTLPPYTTGCSDAAGTYQFVAFDPTKDKQSNTITRTITASSGCAPTGAPTLNSNPSSGDQLGIYFPLTGGGYTPYGTVQLTISPSVNGNAILGQTTANANGLIYYVWATDCSIPAATYSVTARDLAKNQASSPFTLTITSNASCATPGPKITQLSPNPMPGSTQPQYLTIFGSSFQPGLTVRLQKQGQAPTDYTQLDMVWINQIRVNVVVDTSEANWTVQVINPDNTSSAPTPLSVLAGVMPVATSLTNKPAVTKGTKISTKGTNLTVGGSVQILLRLPDGKTVQTIATVAADSSGSFTYDFDTSRVSSFGSHQLFYKDVSTGRLSNEIPATINPVQNGAATNKNHDVHNDPIDTSTGNYIYDHTDLVIPGRGLPFRFARHYESLNPVPGPIGNGWTHSYDATLSTNPVDNSVTIRLGDGYTVIFDLQGGTYKPRYENVYETLTSPSPGLFVMTTKQQVNHTFSMGKLVSISDRNGNAIRLSYVGTNVAAIADTVGRTITLNYDSANRLVSVTDPINRTLKYAYDSASNLVSFTDARDKNTAYTYDSASRMLTGVDPENRTFVTNTYDSLGRVSSQADGQGNTWFYAYDPYTGTTTITDPNQKTALHVHDSELKLITEQDTYGKQTKFGYNSNNNSNSVTDQNGHTTKRVLDQMGNVTQVIDALNQVSTATYNSFNDPLSRTDSLQNTTIYTYDSQGNLTNITDPLGNKTSYVYNLGQVTNTTDAEGRTTTYTYDASGNLIREQDALGNNTEYTYDTVGRRLSMKDALNFVTFYVYDNNDNLIQVTDPLNGIVSYTYDGNNNRLTSKDQRQNTTTYSYDGNYKLTTTTDALGGTVTTAYDKLRNPLMITDQRGGITKTTYDPEGRLILSVDPVGNATSYDYDPAGNRITVTNSLGKKMTYAYDALDRVTSLTDPLGAVTKTSYDALGRTLTSTDAANNVTSFTYDAAGRMTKSTDAANGVVTYAYDKVGNRTGVTDPRGKTTTFTYDGLNRLKTITDPVGNVTTNTYDAVGNLTKVVDGNGNSRTYAYEGNRRLTGITYSIGTSVTYTYDAAGNRTKMIDGEGTSTFTYDALNRMSGYVHPLGTQMQFTYDAASNRTALQYATGKLVRSTYDAANRLSSVADWSNSTTNYGYDVAGRVATINFPNGVAAAYSYDPVGRTTNIQYTKGTALLYSEGTTWSASGNPVGSSISGLSSNSIPSEATSYTYDDASRLATISSGTVLSDKNNNVTTLPGSGSATVFSYDLNNRPTSISGPVTTAQMKYFGDGKLAGLTKSSGTARYLQDPGATGNLILAELDASGNIQRAYIHGLGMVSVIDGPSTYYYMHNLQGSTVAMADGSGALLATYRYDPFGRVIQASGTLTYPFTFLGRYSVPTVGDYSITSYRLYDAKTGRFAEPDPAHWKLNAAISPFIYADQSPTRLIDPSGLFSFSTLYNGAVNLVSEGLVRSGLINYDGKLYGASGFADNQILVDTVKALPRSTQTVLGQTARSTGNFVLCGITLARSEGSCRAAGQSEALIAFEKDMGTVGSYWMGPYGPAILKGIDSFLQAEGLASVALKVKRGEMSPQAALKYALKESVGLSLDLSLEGLAKLFVGKGIPIPTETLKLFIANMITKPSSSGVQSSTK